MLRLLKLWRLAGRDLRLLWFAMRHRQRPAWLIPVAAGLALYALEPLNLALPIVGAIDDLVLLPLALHCLAALLPARIRADYAR
jgi:uncharacterized membrane protein YkvA (DUF1232 family)